MWIICKPNLAYFEAMNQGEQKTQRKVIFLPYCELWSRPTLAFFFLFSFLIWAFLFPYVFLLFHQSFLINIVKLRFVKKYCYQHQLQHFAFFLYPLIWMFLFLHWLQCYFLIYKLDSYSTNEKGMPRATSILLIWSKAVASLGDKLYPLRINPILREG